MYPMSQTLRTDEDIAAVAGYVASLPRANPEPTLEGGDASRGVRRSTHRASRAMAPTGKGNQQLNAPADLGRQRLVPLLDAQEVQGRHSWRQSREHQRE